MATAGYPLTWGAAGRGGMTLKEKLDALEARLDRLEAKVNALRADHWPLSLEDADRIARMGSSYRRRPGRTRVSTHMA